MTQKTCGAKNPTKRRLFTVAAVLFLLTALIIAPIAAEQTAQQTTDEEFPDVIRATGYIATPELDVPSINVGTWDVPKLFSQNEPTKSSAIPDKFDLRNVDGKNYVTPVKDQDIFGTCWSFSAMAAAESNALIQGLLQYEDADFSERHLAYFLYNREGVTVGNVLPELSGLSGDENPYLGLDGYLNAGARELHAALHLATGMGIAPESVAKYEELPAYYRAYVENEKNKEDVKAYVLSTLSISPEDVEKLTPEERAKLTEFAETVLDQWAKGNASKLGLDPQNATSQNIFTVSDVRYISAQDRDEIKKMVMTHGAAGISYNSNTMYENTIRAEDGTVITTNSYCDEEGILENHAVTLIGWNDTYSKEYFKTAPPENGAWLMKNSWSTKYGEEGYFWLSYYDTAITDAAFYIVTPANESESIYQYDGTVSWTTYDLEKPDKDGIWRIAAQNNFIAEEDTAITKVSFLTQNPNLHYTITVESDTSSTTQDGLTDFCGYYTIELDELVYAAEGSTFTVHIAFEAQPDTKNMYGMDCLSLPIDMTLESETDPHKMYSHAEEGQGFIYLDGEAVDGGNIDGYSVNFRIKAVGIYKAPTPSKLEIITPENSPFAYGKTGTLEAELYDQYGRQLSSEPATWQSSKPEALKIGESGNYEVLQGGQTVTITATSETFSSEITITTQHVPTIDNLTITPEQPWDFAYTGEPIAISVVGKDDVKDFIGTITVTYHDGINAPTETPPTKTGTYRVNVSIAENETYTAAEFELGEMTITVKPVVPELPIQPPTKSGDNTVITATTPTGITVPNEMTAVIDANDGIQMIVTFETPASKTTNPEGNIVVTGEVASALSSYPIEPAEAGDTIIGVVKFETNLTTNAVPDEIPTMNAAYDAALAAKVLEKYSTVGSVAAMVTAENTSYVDGKILPNGVEFKFIVPSDWVTTWTSVDKGGIWFFHAKNGVVDSLTQITDIVDNGDDTHTLTFYGSGYSTYGIVGKEKETSGGGWGGSSYSGGSSVWLTETPTPTPTETVTPTPSETVPTDIPTGQPTETPKSPGFGLLGIIAGLGVVAVLRRK